MAPRSLKPAFLLAAWSTLFFAPELLAARREAGRRGIPVVLSPDDPGIMRHTLSHDFYEALTAWELDLRDLKQLALDSLLHSAMGREEKARARAVWERRWAEFVRWLNGPGAPPAALS